MRETLQAKIEQLDLSSRVNLLGSLSQRAVLERLQAADIFALPSTTDVQGATDVFPTVILEAMASARPVVSTRLAGIPELVVDGETGTLISAGDSTALAQALEQLLRDPELRLRFGHAGRARIEQHFRIENTVVSLMEMFEHAVRQRRNIDFPSVRPVRLQPTASSQPASKTAENISGAHTRKMPMVRSQAVAYLIDRWPDHELPLLERELEEMKRRNCTHSPVRVRIGLQCKAQRDCRTSRAVPRISTRCDGVGSRMADIPGGDATIGGRSGTTEQSCPRRNFPSPGAVRARAAETNSEQRRVAHSCYEFPCAGLCAHIKEAPR